MKMKFEERLKKAVSDVEQQDDELASELKEVRTKRGRPAAKAIAPELEAMKVATPGADNEALALETIVLRTGRPVLTIVNDEAQLLFEDAESELWKARLLDARPRIGPAIKAVGRIEVENHELDWIGTGWLVAPDVVVTNRHVAEEFVSRRGEGFVFRQGFGGPISARIDFLEELGRSDAREFKLSEVLDVSDEPGPDVAFARVEQTAGAALADPIELLEREAVPRQQIAVLGYPARDSRIPEQELMLRIFGNVFDKKRLAPGQVKSVQRGLVLHDCSTLGGNSGSVVLDLATGKAIALHFSGRFLDANFAVSAPTIAERLRGLPRRRSGPRPPAAPRPRPDVALLRPGGEGGGGAATGAASILVPLRIHVEVGVPQADGGGPRGNVAVLPRNVVVPAGSAGWGDGAEEDTFLEGRVEDYADRRGYQPDFLGFDLPLPTVDDDGDVLRFQLDGTEEEVLRYEHFSVVMSRSRRMCRYSAVNVDGAESRKSKRSGWRIDPRIKSGQQIRGECYGNPPKFSRGHMTRREDPIWGPRAQADRGNSDSMHVTNVAPQMQPFNAGIWLGLEDYALQNARQDDMKLSVFTGPVLLEDDPVRFGVQIPRSFWKVIAFVHDATGEPCITAYTMNQEDFLREEEFVFGEHETAQVPLSLVEELAGARFSEDLRRLDPLERVAESRPRLLRSFSAIRFR